MNLIRKIKISKITNQALSDKELEIYNFVYNKLIDLKQFTSDVRPESIFYVLNRTEIYLHQDNRNDILRVRYKDFWEVLESKYSIKSDDIKELISYQVWKVLKFKPSTPTPFEPIQNRWLGNS